MKPSHALPFDPSYGYNLRELLAITPPAEPEDLDAFWQATYDEARQIEPQPERLPSPFKLPGSKVVEVRFQSWNNRTIGGWIVEPPDASGDRAVVVGHGYGGRDMPGLDQDLFRRSIQIYPCAPGFHLSPADDIPHNQSMRHVIKGLGHRDTYIIRDCVASLWCAVTAVQALYPSVTDIALMGGSFGGGLGALALPWDERISRAILVVPTFGHHPLRLQCLCQGSGEAVRAYARQKRDPMRVLQYYDAACVASRIRIPVYTVPAMFDPAVPPPGQFAVANAITSPGSELCVRHTGHFPNWPGAAADDRRQQATQQRFMADW